MFLFRKNFSIRNSSLLFLICGFLHLASATVLAATLGDCEIRLTEIGILETFRQEFPASRVDRIEDPRPILVRNPYEHAPLSRPLSAAEQMAKLIEANLVGISAPQMILYPASGFDAATPFQLFTSANTVVGIDNHPFWQDPRREFRMDNPGEIRSSSGWASVDIVDHLQEMGPYILSRLANRLPNFRVREVLTVRLRFHPGLPHISHGVIHFDQGEGTPLRRYIHLHSPAKPRLPGFESWDFVFPQNEWWLQQLSQSPFDGLLRKASMEAFANRLALGGALWEVLAERGGVFVDGDSTDPFVSNSAWSAPRQPAPPANETRIQTNIAELGYGFALLRLYSPRDR